MSACVCVHLGLGMCVQGIIRQCKEMRGSLR